MHGCIAQLDALARPAVGALTPLAARGVGPLDRLRAMQDISSESEWVYVWYLVIFIVLAACVLCLLVLWRRRRQEEGRRAEFTEHARAVGLSDEERRLLSHMAELCGLRNPNTIFTTDKAFDMGVDRLLRSDRTGTMSDELRAQLNGMVATIREKLRFRPPSNEDLRVIHSSRQIDEGSVVTVSTIGTGEPVECTISRSDQAELALRPSQDVSFHARDELRVRYAGMTGLWEFDSTVLRVDDGEIAITHAYQVRLVDRRRFRRLPVKRGGWVALFDFSSAGPFEVPDFHDARLTEIAGPGLQLETDLDVQSDQRVLVVLDFAPRRVIRAVGKVGRVERPSADGTREIVVELVGLASRELAELTRITNQSARQTEGEAEPGEPPASQPATPTDAPQPAAAGGAM